MTAPEPPRWRPARAGILNVYQYEDETLHFAGGRLLLRGVNGSGKSTAMNMLLPFLLEADTRRIDAAGEQTGVLKSWMLADTDETQRTGYLWIEFARPDPEAPGGQVHHTVGCGIRANRNTDRVTTWWFSTPRRAKIDFALTQGRVPLAADALRAELGAEAVFSVAAEYRAEIAKRFFGGADPSGYLALLHLVRNPRVGDRIDADLPRRLKEALPPVPEEAVADAAQPLEDLEDHRRNVVALERTERALAAVLDTYRHYARRVLRAAADVAAAAVTAARGAVQRRGRARAAAAAAHDTEAALTSRVGELQRAHESAAARLTGLMESDAYKSVKALVAERGRVAGLETQATTLATARDQAHGRAERARTAVANRRVRVDEDIGAIRADLDVVARHGHTAGARLPLPEPPVLRLHTLAGGVEGPDEEFDPLAALDPVPAADTVRRRTGDVRRVRGALVDAEAAATAAEAAAKAAAAADEEATVERAVAAEARATAEAAAEQHRAETLAWAELLAGHVAAVPPAGPAGPGSWLAAPRVADPGGGELRADARARAAAAEAAALEAEAGLEPVLAAAAVRVAGAAERAESLAAELAAVRAQQELPLPRAAWQGAEQPDTALFAALVEFAPELDDGARAGLEAACEAAGLLTARVSAAGRLVASTGELLLVPGAPVAPNLASMLVPTGGPEAQLVAAALAHIGVGAGSGAELWVAADGRFGAGPLRGRHTKATAEHIGAGARAAARLRRIAALESAVAAAEEVRAAVAAVLAALEGWRAELRDLRAAIPGTRPVDDTAAAAAGAVAEAQRAAGRAAGARSGAAAADRVAEQRWASASTAAAECALPLDTTDLDMAAAELAAAAAVLNGFAARITAARRSLRDWSDAAQLWEAGVEELADAAAAADAAQGVAESARTALTAAEAALGDEPERVTAQVEQLTAQRAGLKEDLDAAHAAHTAAVKAAATADAAVTIAEQETAGAEAACLAAREALLAVTVVPGMLAAARPDGAAEPAGPAPATSPEPLPDVPETVDGTGALAAAVQEAVPRPERDVGEDTLDRSLRQIRDALGAGWDAGSRRVGDGAPVAIDVSGPYGRRVLPDAAVQVGADLRRARGLLTAKQDQALRNLLHGRVAREVARAIFEARELVDGMIKVLRTIATGQGIGVRLEWRTRGDLDHATATALRLLAKDPDARTEAEDESVRAAVSGLVEEARSADPEASYRDVIGQVLDYRSWHELKIYLRRPGRADELLSRRSRLSEGEKKLVTYLPMAAATSISAAAHDPYGVGAPRLILLDDAFAKVSEDNHERLFGMLVGLDLDFVVTSERLFGTHASVPELSIVEVLRDADLRTIALVHYLWDGRRRTELESA